MVGGCVNQLLGNPHPHPGLKLDCVEVKLGWKFVWVVTKIEVNLLNISYVVLCLIMSKDWVVGGFVNQLLGNPILG